MTTDTLCPHCNVYPANGEWCPKCAGVFGPPSYRRARLYATLLQDVAHGQSEYRKLGFENLGACIMHVLSATDDEIVVLLQALGGDA